MARTEQSLSTNNSKNGIENILRNSLYLTFNAPQVDEYHRGLFLTHPPVQCDSEPRFSGTLFHAAYFEKTWFLDQRTVKDVSTSQSLVLLYRVGTVDPRLGPLEAQFQRIREVLEKVPLGRESREMELGSLEGRGNSVLGGYDCVIWTSDAVTALVREGIADLGGRSVQEVIAEARNLAGPTDAKTMVGVNHGSVKVVN